MSATATLTLKKCDLLIISGEPGVDIELKINYPLDEVQAKSFVLEGKKLKLMKALDRDEKDLSSIVFQVTNHQMTRLIIIFSYVLTELGKNRSTVEHWYVICFLCSDCRVRGSNPDKGFLLN